LRGCCWQRRCSPPVSRPPATKATDTETARTFPRADRPVAGVVSNEFSNEEARDDRNEATKVMDLAGITRA
jgi:hypothetical protein